MKTYGDVGASRRSLRFAAPRPYLIVRRSRQGWTVRPDIFRFTERSEYAAAQDERLPSTEPRYDLLQCNAIVVPSLTRAPPWLRSSCNRPIIAHTWTHKRTLSGTSILRSTESDGDPPIVECGVGSKPHDLHVVVRFARCRDCLVEQGERTSGRCIVADGRSDA